jgi:hypothetical protein
VPADRLDLLRRLTEATPSWTLVKGASSALDGRGDIDCAVPAADRPLIHEAVAAWAAATGRGPVLGCDHLPGSLVLAVVEPGAPATLVQIDLLDHRLLHGSSILRAADLLAAAAVEADGYRRLTPGAEAVARLLLVEWRAGAPRPAAASLAELQSLLAEDPAGASAVASRLDRRLRSAVEAVAAGRWPRSTLVAAELASMARGIRRPGQLVNRLAAAPARRSCPLLKALANERTVEGDPDEWIAAVRRVHPQLRL